MVSNGLQPRNEAFFALLQPAHQALLDHLRAVYESHALSPRGDWAGHRSLASIVKKRQTFGLKIASVPVLSKTLSGSRYPAQRDEVARLVLAMGGSQRDANRGALLFDRVDLQIPLPAIPERTPPASQAWVISGAEGRGHFERRAYGRRNNGQAGDLFRGRIAALTRTRSWMNSEHGEGVPMVVTGQPGAGKSSVVARTALTLEHDGIGPGLAFHARDATHSDFLTAASKAINRSGIADRHQLIECLLGIDAPLRVVVDALDEAASTHDRTSIAQTLLELAALPHVRVVVATRPLADRHGWFAPGSLLSMLDVHAIEDEQLVDLDSNKYYVIADATNLAAALLNQSGVDRQRLPGRAWVGYSRDPELTAALANAIAQRADRNFLVAGMAAHLLSVRHEVVDPRSGRFDPGMIPATVDEAFTKYFDSLGDRRPIVRGLLTALAYARGDGFDDDRWIEVAQELSGVGQRVDVEALRDSPAADYLIESRSVTRGQRTTRLFHQALADQLVHVRSQISDEFRILRILTPSTPVHWAQSDEYIRTHLVDHARRSGQIEALVENSQFLSVCDIPRLLSWLFAMKLGWGLIPGRHAGAEMR